MKIKKLLLSGVLVGALGFSACGSSGVLDEEEAVEKEVADSYYDETLAGIVNETLAVADVDFYRFRLSYLATKRDFEETLDRVSSVSAALDEAEVAGDTDAALQVLNDAIVKDFTNIDYHLLLGLHYYDLGYQADSDFHYGFAEGLMKSILDSGDGVTQATAYEVLTPDEEWTLFAYMGYEQLANRQIDDGSNLYDVVTVLTADGEEMDVYFDVTKVSDFLVEAGY